MPWAFRREPARASKCCGAGSSRPWTSICCGIVRRSPTFDISRSWSGHIRRSDGRGRPRLRKVARCRKNSSWPICQWRVKPSKKSAAVARRKICWRTSSRASVLENEIQMNSSFDVIVIGAGHAGCEAAHAAARLGAHVGLCTLSTDTVAHMPCNPAIGGTAKGHLVREIDALGGLMGLAIDATGIQFKLLNRSRGPAVWSPRAQADKRRYADWVTAALEREPNITWIFGKAGRILIEHGRVAGIAMEEGDRHECGALVITTGTFLNGLIHIGPEQRPAGRHGEPPSCELSDSIRSFGFEMGRLKTGTPPRLDRKSIDFDARVRDAIFVEEPGDEVPVPFSFETIAPPRN